MRTLAEILQNYALQRGEQICMVMQQPGKPDLRISYRDLFDAARIFAYRLDRVGIQPGEVVILIFQHGFELMAAFWGCVLHGAVPSIMPFLTEKLIPDRYRSDLSALIAITHPAAVATYPDFELEAQAAAGERSSLRAVIVAGTQSANIDRL